MKILIADEDIRVRSALKLLVSQSPGQQSISECSDLDSFVTQAKTIKPDLVFLDWELPGKPAAALLFAMHVCLNTARVIVLSRRPDTEKYALDSGADAFFCKTDPPEHLVAVLDALILEYNHE
jgi:DNA-binding NarL/FixJ family response regulator